MKMMFRIITLLLLVAFASLQAQETSVQSATGGAGEHITAGDAAYKALNNDAALKHYQEALTADPANYEATWKLSRAYVDVGEALDNKDARGEHYAKAREMAEKATTLNPQGSKGYLFLSIAVGRVALDAGAMERVRLSKEIKKAVDQALELDDSDDVAWHVLGRWHRRLASLSWVEKKFANIFLGGVPKEASIATAAECFEKAVLLKPTSVNHHLELGITYEELDRKDEARGEYQKALDLPISDSEDQKHKADAKKRLANLG